MFDMTKELNLQLFADGEGRGAAVAEVTGGGTEVSGNATADAGTEAAETAQEMQQGDDPVEQRRVRQAAFEARIKGEDKEFFDARVQKIINQRFKGQKNLENQLQEQNAVIGRIAHRYGIKDGNLNAISQAMEADDAYYDTLAERLGLSGREQAREYERMQYENENYRKRDAENQRAQEQQRIINTWKGQEEEARRIYPNLDLEAETTNPETGKQFLDLLGAGIPVKAAYEAIHINELIGGAMRMTAEKIQQKTVNDIQARGMRPGENGSGGSAVSVTKKSVAQMTRQEREDLERRALRGERIEL